MHKIMNNNKIINNNKTSKKNKHIFPFAVLISLHRHCNRTISHSHFFIHTNKYALHIIIKNNKSNTYPLSVLISLYRHSNRAWLSDEHTRCAAYSRTWRNHCWYALAYTLVA